MNIKIILLLLLSIPGMASAQTCYPSFSNPADKIYHLSFNDLFNYSSPVDSSGVTIYPDTLLTTRLRLGLNYQLIVYSQSTNGSGGIYSAWIDYNDDGTFASGESVYTSTVTQLRFATTIQIPMDTSILGKRKLRIICAETGGTISPCGNYDVGECEDYTVEFTADSLLPPYCVPVFSGSTSYYNKIESFSLNTLFNCQSGPSFPPYTYYNDSIFTTTLEMGKQYNLFVSKGHYAGTSIRIRACIDFNNDHMFSSVETILSGELGLSNAQVTIPYNPSYVGKRRLRVFLNSSYPLNLCVGYSNGEVEDYDVTIAYPTPDTTFIANKWEKVFEKPGDQHVFKLVETYDKGYLLSGKDFSYAQVNMLKTTIDGDIISDSAHHGTDYHDPFGLDDTYEGGYVVSGATFRGGYMPTAYIGKFSACGNPVWKHLYGDTTRTGYLQEVFQMPDSGFLASGTGLIPQYSNDTGRISLLRTDKDGNQIWLKDYTYFFQSGINSLLPTSDKGALITVYGYRVHSQDSSQIQWRRGILTKVDSLGSNEWNLVIDSNNMICSAKASVELDDHGFITAGYVDEAYTDVDHLALFRVSQGGKLLRLKIHNYDGSHYHYPKVIRKINNNRFLLMTSDISDCDLNGIFPNTSVFLIDSNFNILVQKQIDVSRIRPADAIINSDGKIVLAGIRQINDTRDIYMAKLNPEDLSFDTIYNINLVYDSLCDDTNSIEDHPPISHSILIHPNPTNGLVRVEIGPPIVGEFNLDVFDARGVLVRRIENSEDGAIEIDLRGRASGLYPFRILFRDGTSCNGKIIKK